MKILVTCEESQTVCKAFRARGHEAYSCDIQEPSGGHPEWHILGDALKAIEGGASDHHGRTGACHSPLWMGFSYCAPSMHVYFQRRGLPPVPEERRS